MKLAEPPLSRSAGVWSPCPLIADERRGRQRPEECCAVLRARHYRHAGSVAYRRTSRATQHR